MPPKTPQTLEFIGGPFDGHLELLPAERGDPPEHVLCYISENSLRQLHGQDATNPFSVTSVAIYTLLLHRGEWAYFFVKAVAPDSVAVQPRENKFW